jgi:hypothetical protein
MISRTKDYEILSFLINRDHSLTLKIPYSPIATKVFFFFPFISIPFDEPECNI